MKRTIGGSIIAGFAVIAGLCGCSKPSGGEVDYVDLVASPPPPPAPGFFLALIVTPRAVAGLEASHDKIAVEAHYYNDSAASDTGEEIGVEVHEIAVADLNPLYQSQPPELFAPVVITGKAVAAKVDRMAGDPTITATASVPDGSLTCTTYNALLSAARKAQNEIRCDLAPVSASAS